MTHIHTAVFIVEDEALIAMELEDRLTGLGYNVCGSAVDGETALQQIPESGADVVLMDIRLAGDLDGVETALRLRERSDAAVIFLSAYSDHALVHRAGTAVPYGYIVKPFDGQQIHLTIQIALSRRQLERAITDANETLDARVRERTIELEESQRLLSGINTNLPGTVVYRMVFPPDGLMRCTYMSPNTQELLGIPAADFVADATLIFRLMEPDDQPTVRAILAEALQTGNPADTEFRLRLPDGRVRWFQYRSRLSHRLPDGTQIRDGVATEITAAKATEATLRESEERLAVTLHSIGDAVMVTDVEARITRMNLVAEQLTGWTQAEARGRLASDVFRIVNEQTGAATSSPVDDVLTTGLTHELANHTALIAKDGSRWSIADSAAPIRDAAGSLVGVVLVFRDESERRERQHLIERQRAMLAALHDVQEQFIHDPGATTAFDSLLTTLLHATSSEYGLLGEVVRDEAGHRALTVDAANGAAHGGATQETLDLQALVEAVMTDGASGGAISVADNNHRTGSAVGHPTLRAFLGIPIHAGGEMVGILGIANRPEGNDDALVTHLRPLLSTYASLIVARRINQKRRRAEAEVRRLNADLEREVERRTAALDRSERAFSSLATVSPVGIFRTDSTGTCLFVNERWSQITGLSSDEALGTGWLGSVHADDARRVRRVWDATIAAQAPFRAEYRFVHAGRRVTWVLGQALPLRDALGLVTGYIGTLTDVTEQKHTEQALRVLSVELVAMQGDEFYQGIVRALVALLDCDAAFIRRTIPGRPGHLRTLAMVDAGRTVDDFSFAVVDTPCADVLAGHACSILSGVQQRYPRDRSLTEQGFEGYAAAPLVDRRGVVIGTIGIMSRRALASAVRTETLLQLFGVSVTSEMERQREAGRFHSLVEFAPDAIVMIDDQGVIRLVNRKAEQLFGWTRAELVGQPVELLVPVDLRARHGRDRLQFIDSPHQRPMGPHLPELHARRKDGSEFTVEISLSPIDTDDGLMVTATVRDVSDRQRLERQARRAQRMDAIGTLAGGIAHDLNNALAPITMSLSLLRERPDNTRMLDAIERSAMRATDMVRQLLVFAKGAEGIRGPVEVKDVVRDLEAIIQPTFPKNITLDIVLPATVPTVTGDATQLHQVLLNLCVNGRDAMPDGGSLTVEVDDVQVDAAFAATAPDATVTPGRYVVIKIRDTGTGIPPEIADRIFDPFFSTKGPNGSGLGLSTVLGVVKSHWGFVLVSSHMGRGTTFAVYLPVGDGADTAAPTVQAPRFNGQGELVLLVDDEPVVREVARDVLGRLNLTAVVSASGADGLAKAALHRHALRAVITDVHMPNMNGVAFVRALRTLLPDVPVIVSSGRLDESTADEFAALGVRLTLDKPFTEEKLAAVLQSALQRR